MVRVVLTGYEGTYKYTADAGRQWIRLRTKAGLQQAKDTVTKD